MRNTYHAFTGGTTTPPLEFHTHAKLGGPLMEGDELDALAVDIKENGQREPIVTYEGKILDRNRYNACRAAGIKPDIQKGDPLIDDPIAYVISANLHRRHLTSKQKHELIAVALKARPEKSNVAIAKVVKVDDKTVASVRQELEARSEIPNVPTRIDSRGRKQPVKKAKAERNRKARERRAIEREAEREANWKEHEGRRATAKAHAVQLATDLIAANRDLAERVLGYLAWEAGDPDDLRNALRGALEPVEAEPAPADASVASSSVVENSTVAENAPAPKKKCGWPKGKSRKLKAAAEVEPAQAGAPIVSAPAVATPKFDAADLEARSAALAEGYANPGEFPESCRRQS